MLHVAFVACFVLVCVNGLIPTDQCTQHHDQSPLCYVDYSKYPIQPCASVSAALKQRAEGKNVTYFAQIGDFGLEGPCPQQVRGLIDRLMGTFGPIDFIHSTGDNDYWSGACDQMWQNIGQYYSGYIPKPKSCDYEYLGSAANWSETSRFWPTVGNHDWTPVSQGKATIETLPYAEYFSYLAQQANQQKNGLHYKVSFNNLDMYALNSNWDTQTDQQDMFDWLKQSMATGTAPFQLVFAHHPAYSTAHADQPLAWLRQPYKDWNPNRVLFFSGHEHVYERIELNNQSYIINGLGGHPWRYYITECVPTEGSQVRFSALHGAAIAAVTEDTFSYCFYSADGKVIDEVKYTAVGKQ